MARARASIDLKLDHFKVYKQYYYDDQKPRKLRLKGQFDRRPLPGLIDHMPYFANPVRKNKSGIVDRNAHLAFYDLEAPEEPRRVVIIRNQFGIQKLLICDPLFLLVPSEKIEKRSAFPKRLDHFKAYRVLEGQIIDRTVLLSDQIDREDKVEVTRPELFCVPVEKTHGKYRTRIYDPECHLTFYSITPRKHRVPKASKDQFGKRKILLATSLWLGVPTLKLEYDVIG